MRYLLIGALALATAPAFADPAAEVKTLEATVARLEARVKVLEDANAKYAEALEFLSKVYQQQKQQEDQRERSEMAPDGVFAVDIAQDLKNGQVEGPAGAAVTIVMAFDFADPYSNRTRTILAELLKQYAGKLRVVYKHMIVHPQTVTHAHQAVCAAGIQHKFVEFWRRWWDEAFEPYATARDATKLDGPILLAIAGELGLDATRFKADMASPMCEERIKADQTELEHFQVAATPTFFVNGTVINGAQPKETFTTMIDDKLKLVAASKIAPARYYEQEILGKGEHKFRSKKDPKPH